jgi:hypothetical protein
MAANPWAVAALFGSVVLWNLVYVVWRVRKIRRSGKSVLARPPEGALFVERWTSGNSDLNFLSEIGGASNCLQVALTRERFSVRLHCPFNLVGGNFDLEHDVSLADVGGVRVEGRLLKVALPGRTLTLRLRNPGGFFGVWKLVRGGAGELRPPSAPPSGPPGTSGAAGPTPPDPPGSPPSPGRS